ncbi:MAG: fused MFS/spermidine synthase, partial [Planctomycetaceae bacterium]
MLPAPLLLPLFLAGGAAALIDEVTWFQLLALHAGGTSRAMAAVLATFMAGLGAGAILAPRLGRSRRPMVVCAVLEAAIGVCALAMPALLPAIGRLPPALQAPGFTLALLAPAVAMGATLPVAARALGSGRAAARAVGWLYAANTLGGVIGCLLAGFWLLRVHDTAVAARVAAGTSGLAAAWALFLATRSPSAGVGAAPSTAAASATAAARRAVIAAPPLDHALLVVTCLSGMTALAAEVVWTRLLALLLGGTTYTFSLILACFLVGIAIGAAVAATLAPPRGWLAWCHAALVPAIAFGAWAAGVGLPAWPIDPRLSPSPWVQLQIDLVRCLVVVLPAAILWGASLPLCIAAAVRDGRADAPRAAAAVLAANTLGAVLGSLAAALLLLPGAGSRTTTQWVVVVAALAALVALPPRRRAAGGAGRFVAPGLALALAAILVPRLPALAPSLVGWGRYAALYRGEPSEFLVVREGADSTLAVSRNLVGTLNYHNAGKVQASGEPQDMRLQRMLGHIVTLVPESPRRVLVIGCGAGVTAGSVSVDPEVEEETICEIEAEVPRTAGEYFTSINDGVIANPKVRVRIDDARRFLRETEGTFDAITSDPFDPWVRGAANLYTEEFFTLAKRRLSPGGAITVFVQLYEAGTPAVKSEIATFLRVFPEGLVFGNTSGGEGYDLVLLGTNGPTTIDLDRIDGRIRAPGAARLRESLAAIGCDNAADLFASYAAAGPQLAGWLEDAQINRDTNLRLQYLAGLGVNAYEQAPIYRSILAAGDWPEGV